ncbi:hypothetical protein DFH08DRAFT_824445 [Mycena albidolilacea]|uniref:Uncharacterized protein n=1 Tax=Mycena albidolilacea TaxID=1033008 RepID=A0AAD7EAL0_9AGAR|nr:hypothetical protein DFH08DRAFT_824445 [Mycena albidolilacea]
MPYTQNPDHFAALGIYKAPAYLTKEEFEAHMITLTDNLLAIPISKNNFQKFDLILQNNKLDKYIQHLGLPTPHPSVWQICESEIVKDKDFKERIDAAEHFGFHAGSCSFSADLKTKIFIPTSNDRCSFSQQEVPEYVRPILQPSRGMPSCPAGDRLRILSSRVVSMIEAETIENVVEFIHDVEVISLVMDALSHVPSLLECTCFCADIVAKINKDEA